MYVCIHVSLFTYLHLHTLYTLCVNIGMNMILQYQLNFRFLPVYHGTTIVGVSMVQQVALVSGFHTIVSWESTYH